MTDKHKRFDFDEFDKLCGEILDDEEAAKIAVWGVAKVVTEADIKIEGSADVIIYDPNEKSLWE